MNYRTMAESPFLFVINDKQPKHLSDTSESWLKKLGQNLPEPPSPDIPRTNFNCYNCRCQIF